MFHDKIELDTEIPESTSPISFDLADISFYALLTFLSNEHDFCLLHHPLFVLAFSVVYTLIVLYLINYLPPFIVIPVLVLYSFINYNNNQGLLIMVYVVLEIIVFIFPSRRRISMKEMSTPSNANIDKRSNINYWVILGVVLLLITGYLNYGTYLPPPFYLVSAIVFMIFVLVSANITTLGRNSSGEIFLYTLIAMFVLVFSVLFFLIMYMHGKTIIDHLVSLMVDMPINNQNPDLDRSMPASVGITADIWHITKLDHYLPMEFTIGGWTPHAMLRALIGETVVLMVFCSYYLGPGELQAGRISVTPRLDEGGRSGFGTLNFSLFYVYSILSVYRIVTQQFLTLVLTPIATGVAWLLYKIFLEGNWRAMGVNATMQGRSDMLINVAEKSYDRMHTVMSGLWWIAIIVAYGHGVDTLSLTALTACSFIKIERYYTVFLGFTTCNLALVCAGLISDKPLSKPVSMNLITAGTEQNNEHVSALDELFSKLREILKEIFGLPGPINRLLSGNDSVNIPEAANQPNEQRISGDERQEEQGDTIDGAPHVPDEPQSGASASAHAAPGEQTDTPTTPGAVLSNMMLRSRRLLSSDRLTQNCGTTTRDNKWRDMGYFHVTETVEKHGKDSIKCKKKGGKEKFREIFSREYMLD